jgi:hypothetical protein
MGPAHAAVGRWIGRTRVLLLACALASGAVFPSVAAPAWAEADMCLGDPAIVFDTGQVVDIDVRLPLSQTTLFSRSQVSASNPVVLEIHVPSNVRALLRADVSPLYPMRVELVRAGAASSGPMQIAFRVYAPDQGEGTRYTLGYIATSLLEQTTATFTSGTWATGWIRVPH